MNEDHADERLRSLFREVGGHTAPADLENRILQQLAVAPAAAPDPKPLLPRWAWMFAALVLGVSLVLGLNALARAGTGMARLLPEGLLDGLFRSPWLSMALAAVALLMALNTWLHTRLATSRAT